MSVFTEKKEEESTKVQEEIESSAFSEAEHYNAILRAANIIFGGMTFLGCFLFLVFGSYMFLLFPFLAGALQLLCPISGFCPIKSVAKMFEKKEED